MSIEPGLHPHPDGQQKDWDGQNRTEPVAPVVAVGPVQSDGPVIGQTSTGEALEDAKRGAMRMVWVGLAILFVGIAITVGTYVAAPEGGTFVAAWGAVLIGGIRLAQGLFYLANPARLLK